MKEMKNVIAGAVGLFALGCATPFADAQKSSKHTQKVYKFTAKLNDGKVEKLGAYKGKVMLIVNTASRCGYTPQYAGMQRIYKKYKKKGLVVLAFPANDFGGQEPGSNKQIRAFCQARYKISFPLFSKIAVTGKKKHPLYRFLTDKRQHGKLGGAVTWNFTKFLVDRKGRVVARFAPGDAPESSKVSEAIRKYLKQKK